MSEPASSFDQFCYDAAGQFLQTVVVIDNEAVLCDAPCPYLSRFSAQASSGASQSKQEMEEAPGQVFVPSGGSLGEEPGAVGSQSADSDQCSEVPAASGQETTDNAQHESDSQNILKAAPLVNSFADKGVICSVLRPDSDDPKVVERAALVASNADIVVVDWQLGASEGEAGDYKAKKIIKSILENDFKKNGRLRLIAIYTAEQSPAGIIDDVFDAVKHIKFETPLKKDGGNFCIENKFLKICVLLKSIKKRSGGHVVGASYVDFEDLPDKLHSLFCELNKGLLPSVALRAISVIREGTHHLLTVLHNDLDPAIVGHRCLLPYPKDAEEFCEDIISGEIRSMLSLGKIGSSCFGKEQVQMWLDSKLNVDGIIKFKDFEATSKHITLLLTEDNVSRCKSFVGQVQADRKSSGGQQNGVEKLVANNITHFLCQDDDKGKKYNFEFSRLTSFKRESSGNRIPPVSWLPKLTLGTVVQRVNDREIFICLQPRCESVRLDKDEKRFFPFIKVGNKTKSNCICIIINTIKDADKCKFEEVEFYIETKPKNQAVFEFVSNNGHIINAVKKENFYIFHDASEENSFYWLGDLKDQFAQNIVGKISDAVSSVGINPFEWQRLKNID